MHKRFFWFAGVGFIGLVLLIALTATGASADDPPGAALFKTYCAACHGEGGKGGIAPAIVTAEFLTTHDDAALTLAVQDGKPETGMPAWGKSKGGTLTDEQIGAIVSYLRAFGPATASEPTALPETPSVATPVSEATPLPTAAPIQTTLTAVQSTGDAGVAVVTATLKDGNGAPIGGKAVSFSRATSFGTANLGTARTDSKGNASLTLLTVPTNARQIVVAFKGDKGMFASETKLELAPHAPAEAPSSETLPGKVRLSLEEPLLLPEGTLITPNPPLLPTAIFALVVGCVWMTYGLVVYQVFSIWKIGRSRPYEHGRRR